VAPPKPTCWAGGAPKPPKPPPAAAVPMGTGALALSVRLGFACSWFAAPGLPNPPRLKVDAGACAGKQEFAGAVAGACAGKQEFAGAAAGAAAAAAPGLAELVSLSSSRKVRLSCSRRTRSSRSA